MPCRHRGRVGRTRPARPLTSAFRDGTLRRFAGWLAILALLLQTAIPLGQAVPFGDDALARALIICTGNDAGAASDMGDAPARPAGKCPVCLAHAIALAPPGEAPALDAPHARRLAAWSAATTPAVAPSRRHERPLVRGPPLPA